MESGLVAPTTLDAVMSPHRRFVALYRLPANVSQDWVPACSDSQGNFSFLGEGDDHRLQVTTYVQR